MEDHGSLTGLVTVKDVLKFIALEKTDTRSSWDERGGLDGMLEEVWRRTSEFLVNLVAWSRSLIRR